MLKYVYKFLHWILDTNDYVRPLINKELGIALSNPSTRNKLFNQIENLQLAEGLCPKCGNPFYIVGGKCWTCGYDPSY